MGCVFSVQFLSVCLSVCISHSVCVLSTREDHKLLKVVCFTCRESLFYGTEKT